ncbi:Aspartyl/asparaginyl beta-hydroxylase [Frankliniella fusca]|uniref:Aspartyl/asparaginyl beta-hydroxylase n=1 Tax=Frankliniella fusca TaxID=407009 RepID=A0AAE1HSV6_9NEOP|nr:Aspartyl/asparaginyl beta-hydroxylase [Frankliniella fusca]
MPSLPASPSPCLPLSPDEPSLPPFVYVKEEPAAAAPAGRDGGGGSPSAASSDELIHIYKESRLGGNICAKIIFFLLLGTLTVMVGLIITEHRGSSEVATAADSPWSQLLEGWIDDSPPDKHDDEHDLVADSGEHDEHDEHDEGGGHDEDGHDEEHDEEQDEEHDEDHDEEHDESDVIEQEYTARAARSVASESKVSGEEEEEGADEDHGEEEEEEEREDEEEGDEDEDEDGGENEEEDEDNEEDENTNAAESQEEEDGPEEFDEADEPEGQDDQESPQLTEETSQVDGEDEQNENDVSGEDNFVFKEIPGVTASAEDLDDTGDDDSQGEVDQVIVMLAKQVCVRFTKLGVFLDEEDDISESAGKVSDAGYYSAHEDDINDSGENDDDDGDDGNENDNIDRVDEAESQDDDNNTDDGDGEDDDDDDDEDGEANEDNFSEMENQDSELQNNNSEENEEAEDEISLSRNEENSNEKHENSFHVRGDQSPENEDNEDEKEGEETSDDPDEGFDEPFDNDDDDDNNGDDNFNDHSRNIDEYEEIDRDFDSLGTSPLSEREDISTEQHVESDDDFEEITDVPENTEPEKANEEEESMEPITHEAGATTLQPSSNPATAVPRRQTLIPPTVDPSNLIPEPDDVEALREFLCYDLEYSDEEFEEDEDEEDAVHTKVVRQDLVRKYGKISSEVSDEEEIEEEEEDLEEDEDIEEEEDGPEREYDKRYGYKLGSVPTKETSQEEREEDEELEDEEEDIEDEEVEDEEGEYMTHSHPWKSIRQPRQESDQEVSDGEEISGSEDEASPPPAPAAGRKTGGPKEVNEFPEWPMGPDYPQEQAPTPREFQDLHAMEAQIEENPEAILKQVKRLLASKPENLALLSLEAQALDKLAEIKRSNKLLEDAIKSYVSLLRMTDLSDNLFLKFANRTLNRMRFRGQYGDAIGVHKMLISRFPQDPRHRNDLAVSYLMAGRVSSAKLLLEEILRLWPSNGFALVHYGFILKTSENDNEAGSHFLQAGINSGEPGTMDARFLFHLGDAYNRLGKNIHATKVYELGVEKGLFRSKYQRSLYNVDRLTARPWWSLHQTTYEKELRTFEEHWKEIRSEGLAILETHSKTSAFKDEAENLRDKGVWKQLELYARGQQVASNCKRAPVTCQLISQFPAARSCRRGQAKFSVMHPNTHVWPHCGPTNCRLRAHLGLVVPAGTELRVGEEKRSWQEGKMFVFDDSFEHEVWHNGSSIRLVLIVDIWHPELTDHERRSLPAI